MPLFCVKSRRDEMNWLIQEKGVRGTPQIRKREGMGGGPGGGMVFFG